MPKIPTPESLEAGERIRFHRERRRPSMTQQQLATALGAHGVTMSERAIRSVEYGQRNLGDAEREALAAALGTTADFPMPEELLRHRVRESLRARAERSQAARERKAAAAAVGAMVPKAPEIVETIPEIIAQVREERDMIGQSVQGGSETLAADSGMRRVVTELVADGMAQEGTAPDNVRALDWRTLPTTCAHERGGRVVAKAPGRNPYCPCCNYGYAHRPKGRNTYLLCAHCSWAWQTLRQKLRQLSDNDGQDGEAARTAASSY